MEAGGDEKLLIFFTWPKKLQSTALTWQFTKKNLVVVFKIIEEILSKTTGHENQWSQSYGRS